MTVVFLGAGASAADGVPVQGKLFEEYFSRVKPESDTSRQVREDISTYFKLFFHEGLFPDCRPQVPYPTFEEAIGVLELAEQRGEEFRGVDLPSSANAGSRIGKWRLSLVLAMAETIAATANSSGLHHRQLVKSFADEMEPWVFVTTNYDILLDNALAHHYEPNPGERIDYGFDYRNLRNKDQWSDPLPGAVPLLKLHGSLNWLRCRACNKLTLTPFEKGTIQLVVDPASCECLDCRNTLHPVIVPPSFNKDFSSSPLNGVWESVDRVLRGSEQIIFCGYSLPDADLHIKYLLKRAVRNQVRGVRKRVHVFNWHEDKGLEEAEAERLRFVRLLGPEVRYGNVSFEDFAKAPKEALRG